MLTYRNTFKAESISLSSPQYTQKALCLKALKAYCSCTGQNTCKRRDQSISLPPSLHRPRFSESAATSNLRGSSRSHQVRLQTAHAFTQFTSGARQRDCCVRLDNLRSQAISSNYVMGNHSSARATETVADPRAYLFLTELAFRASTAF